jgi:hypothetical protein
LQLKKEITKIALELLLVCTASQNENRRDYREMILHKCYEQIAMV